MLSMKSERILRKVLHDHGSKVTKPRLIVFQLLLHQPPRSLSLLTQLAEDQVDRVTVYRTIDLFEKLGIVRRVTIGWKYKVELSEIFLDHHHHMSCLLCNRVIAVKENHRLESLIQSLAQSSDFIITSHQLELQGYCQKCHSRRLREKQ